MKVYIYSLIILTALCGIASCGSDSRKPGKVYMPDMSYSRAYEFYSQNPNYANGLTAQAPVKGTIARGSLMPDHLGPDDTTLAKANTFAGTLSMVEIEEGGRLYNIHCGVCHGANLDGNGPLYNGGAGKYPAAPANFKDAKYLNMPVGTMYHAIMFGKNLMGSYASQLDAKQRWMVLAHIKKTQAANGGAPFENSFTTSTEVTTVSPTAATATKNEKEIPVKPMMTEAEKKATEAAVEMPAKLKSK